MYKWGEGAACRTAQSAPRIILVTWWSNQDHLDCVKFSSSSVLGLVCVHLFEDSSCKFFHLARWSTCHGYNLVVVWLISIWRYVRAKWLQFCPALCNAIDRSLPGSSIISQARILGWVAMPSSRGSSRPGDGTHVSYVSCLDRQGLYH